MVIERNHRVCQNGGATETARASPSLFHTPVVVRALDPQGVASRNHAGEGHPALGAEVDPVVVEALEPVAVAVLLGRREVEGGELERQEVIAVLEGQPLDLEQGTVEDYRLVEAGQGRQHHRRHVGIGFDAVREEGVEAVRAAEEELT